MKMCMCVHDEPSMFTKHCLVQADIAEVCLHHHIGNGIENEFHIGGVRGTGEVRVDVFLVWGSVHAFELHTNKSSRFFVGVLACWDKQTL